MSFEALYSNRRTRDIFEDYDLRALRVPPGRRDTAYPATQRPEFAVPRLRLLRLRPRTPGVELLPRHAGRRQAQLQRARVRLPQALRQQLAGPGVLHLERRQGQHELGRQRRLPGRRAVPRPACAQPVRHAAGLIRHLFKAAVPTASPSASSSGTASWNSGTIASRTFRASGRNLPLRVRPPRFVFARHRRPLAGAGLGGHARPTPTCGQLDLRVQYVRQFGRIGAEVFVDIFNVLDNQDAMRNQDLVAGQGGVAFGDGLTFIQPRRAFLGVRLRF